MCYCYLLNPLTACFPFLLPGKSYDERVDIFSFGIMLCEVSDSYLVKIQMYFLCSFAKSDKIIIA